MKKLLHAICTVAIILPTFSAWAQCGVGFNPVALRWDALNFKTANTTSQKYALGKHTLEFTYTLDPAGGTLAGSYTGVNNLHTAVAGADVNFQGNVTITLTIQPAISNLNFSVYDVDYNQKLEVTATEVAGPVINRPVVLTKAVPASTVLGAPGFTAPNTYSIQATSNAAAETTNDGTVNVSIAGPVTNVTLKLSNTDTKTTGPAAGRESGDWWVSAFSGCTSTSFATSYRSVSQPYVGQPGYLLVARDNSVYMVNPATGKSVLLFSDPSNYNINSMGYDPNGNILYFTNSLTAAGGGTNAANKTIKKYNFNTNTLSVFVNDVTAAPLLIPTFGSGVESGGASFYDGQLYLGVEGDAGGVSTVWRIDINGSGAATSATQVWSMPTDNHDWGDFVVSNGVLYDFDGKASNEDLYHLSLTNATITNVPLPSFSLRQVAVDWNEQIYNIGGAPASTGEVAPYNPATNTINTGLQKTITLGATTPSGSWGDAAEAFKPKSDFGDAPASFDPGVTPAMHDPSPNLRLGATIDYEGNKSASGTAAADGSDEDGLPFVQVLVSGSNYYTDVSVYNNTGDSAALCGWVDFNGDGQFQSGEGVRKMVPSSASSQIVQLFWGSVSSSLVANSYTFLRLRLAEKGDGLDVTKPTGFIQSGEVEDYYVVVNAGTLETKLTQFSAVKAGEEKAALTWQVSGEELGTRYAVQRSGDGTQWQTIAEQQAKKDGGMAQYQFEDAAPVKPAVYYRIRYTTPNGKVQYSSVQKLKFAAAYSFGLRPNPAQGSTTLYVTMQAEETASVQWVNAIGHVVQQQTLVLKEGMQAVPLSLQGLKPGVYHVRVATASGTMVQKLNVQ